MKKKQCADVGFEIGYALDKMLHLKIAEFYFSKN